MVRINGHQSDPGHIGANGEQACQYNCYFVLTL